jgi:hypothetical protein
MNNIQFAYGGFEVQFRAYVTSALDSDKWAAPWTDKPTEALEKKIRCLCGELNTDCPVAQHVQVKFTLEQAMKAQKGGRSIALLFL